MEAEAKVIKITATFQAPDQDGTWVESCFTVSSRDTIPKEERNELIHRIAPDMAKLQGLPGTNVTVTLIEVDE